MFSNRVWMTGGSGATDERPPELTVCSVYNHVYFYSPVNADRCLALIREARLIDSQLRSEYITRGLPADFPEVPIWLHMHSPGGDVFAALSLVDQLKALGSPVHSIVEGACCSAATIISMACKKRYITPRSFMLIHQFSALMWGTYEEFKDELEMQARLMDCLVEFYEDHSSMSEKVIRERLKRDFWMTAKEAISDGFVDELLTAW